MLPLQLQPQSHIPLYIQLRDQLRALVHTGELRPGDRIPASRELATHLGVHRTTVANAYAELESEGLIQGHVGRGTFICAADGTMKITPPAPSSPISATNGAVRWESLFSDERGDEALSRLTDGVPAEGISFVLARPDAQHFPVAAIRQCCNTVMKREGARILQMGASDGYGPLKEVLLDLLRSEGLQLRNENLLITDGCQQALDLICKAFLRPGDSVVMENPTYPGAIAIFAGARVRCLGVPVRAESPDPKVNGNPLASPGVDLNALEATLMANRVKLIVLTPDFQNPTGTSLTIAARRRVIEIAARYQVPIVEDHIYARLRTREKTPSLKQLDRGNGVIQIDSFSKMAFPGLRVGWCIAPENVIERLRLVKQTTDLHTDQLSQATLAEFIRRGWLVRHLNKMRALYTRRLAAIEKALERHLPEGARWTRPEGGMCVWVELPAGFDASELLIHAREHGVLFAPGRYFYFQNPQPNTLRLGFAGVAEREIARGIATLADVLRVEMRKRQRGARRAEVPRVALV